MKSKGISLKGVLTPHCLLAFMGKLNAMVSFIREASIGVIFCKELAELL